MAARRSRQRATSMDDTSTKLREVTLDAPDGVFYSVGTYRFVGEPQPFDTTKRLFTFFR